MAEDYNEIPPEEVAKYIEEQAAAPAPQPAPKKKRQRRKKKDAEPESNEEVLKASGVSIEGSREEGNFRLSVEADESFSTEQRQKASLDMFASVRKARVEVTDSDKMEYLLAVMDEKPVELDVKLFDRVVVRLRTLTPYEDDLVQDAVVYYMKKNPGVSALLIQVYMQQFDLSMRVVSFNGKDMHPLRFVNGEGERAAHVAMLAEDSMKRMSNVPSPRYKAYVTAADVFLHKMKELDEASLNEDFWHPASADLS